MDDPAINYDQDLWQQIVKLAWPALAIPQQYGGLGLGYLELCVLAQELGRSLAPVPFSSTVYLFSEAIKQFASARQKEFFLPQIASGELLGCLAVSEQIGDSILTKPSCIVKAGKLSGNKLAVLDGMQADYALVSALSESGKASVYLVDLSLAGVTKLAINSIDPSRPLANLSFAAVPAQALGEGGSSELSASDALATLYDKAAVLIVFEQVGGCEASLNMGIKYTKQRYAFGRSVASFQAIKHKFADMYVAKEIALSNAYYAAWALASDAAELPLAAATARVSAIDAYSLCSKENLQAHGGMGYTWEFDCHLHYRRAQHLSLLLGSAHYWKNRLADQLLRQNTGSAAEVA